MKKTLLLITLLCGIEIAHAQVAGSTKTTLSPKERAMNDSLCNCMSKINLSAVKSAQQAEAAFTDCMTLNMNALVELAEERHIEIEDQAAMHSLGVEIGKNLFKQNCASFGKLALIMSGETKDGDGNAATTVIIGTFKRMDTKGFNYVVVSVGGSEKSLLWLKQFPNSELLMNPANLAGKKVKVTYVEYEAYLPQAKGYYKVKEITGVEVGR